MDSAPTHTDTEPQATATILDGRRLFFLACWEAYRDGTIDAEENKVLNKLRKHLGLKPEVVRNIASAARHDCQKRGFRPGVTLDPHKLYARAKQLAEREGGISTSEANLLKVLRVVTGLPHAVPKPEAAPAPAAAVPKPAPAPAAPAPEPARTVAIESPIPPAKKAQKDSGGGEDSARNAYGDPTEWSFTRICSMGVELISNDRGFYTTLAVLAMLTGLVPFLGIVTRPLIGLLVIGAVYDRVAGRETGELTVADTWERHSGAILPWMWTTIVHMFLVTVGILGLILFLAPVGMLFGTKGAGGFVSVVVSGVAMCVFAIVCFRAGLFMTQEVILERTSGTEAILQSYRTAAHNLHGVCFNMLGFLLIVCSAFMALFFVGALPMGIGAGVIHSTIGSGLVLGAYNLVTQAVFGFACAFLGLWSSVTWTLLYLREKAGVR